MPGYLGESAGECDTGGTVASTAAIEAVTATQAAAATPRYFHRVAEGDEGAPRLYVNVTGLDAMREQLLASGLHVGYHNLDSFLGARRHVGDAGAHDDGARRPGWGELHKPQRLVHLVVVIGVETYLIHIEGLGAVNIGHRYRHEFDLPVHAGHAIPRLRH